MYVKVPSVKSFVKCGAFVPLTIFFYSFEFYTASMFLCLCRYCFIVTLGYLIVCQITRVYVFDYGMYSADFTG